MLRVLPIGELPSPFGPWQIAQLRLKMLFPGASSAAAKPPRARARNSAARSRTFISVLKSRWGASIKEHHNKRDGLRPLPDSKNRDIGAPGRDDFAYLDADVHCAARCSAVGAP